MNRLPDGWQRIAISDVFQVNPGHKDLDIPLDTEVTFLPMPNILEEKNAILTDESRQYKEVKKGYTKFIEGDVLFAKITPCMENGKLAIAKGLQNELGCGTTELHVFRTTGVCSSKFLYYYLHQKDFRNYCKSQFSGAVGQQRVSKQVFQERKFPLPPINEQKRIVVKLDQLFAHLDTVKDRLERIPELLKQFRQTVLTQAVTGKLTQDIPSNWRKITIDTICKESFYGPRFSSDDYDESGIPTVRTTDMTNDGKIVITPGTPKVQVPSEKIESFRVKNGDLLITRTGSIGKMAIYNSEIVAIPSAYLIRFRFDESAINTKFLYFYLISPKGQFEMGLHSTAITQPNINAKKIRSIEIPYPPLDLQKEIVHRVESLLRKSNKIEQKYQSLKEKIERLPQTILAKAFRGELVEQYLNDEPAGELFERIQTAKPNNLKKKKKQVAKASATHNGHARKSEKVVGEQMRLNL